MAEFRPLYVFPALERVSVYLTGNLLRRFEAFTHTRGWSAEQTVQVLLAYLAEDARGRRLSLEERRNDLTAARNELRLLQHRMLVAEDTIEKLEAHLRGLDALLEEDDTQRRNLLDEQSRLRRRVEALTAEAVRRAIPLEEMSHASPQEPGGIAARPLEMPREPVHPGSREFPSR